MRWDPEQYLRFADERGRPFRDLVARVSAQEPSTVVDLGCGPGNLTRELVARWPRARVEGLDASAEMIAKARAGAGDRAGQAGGDQARASGGDRAGPAGGDQARASGGGEARFEVGDLREWDPPEPVDVVVSNATLQWVPGHLALLDRLAERLAPGGWLAFQVPGNFGESTHTELAAVRDLPRWRERLAGARIARPAVEEPATYLARLAGLGLRAEVWETTYLQVLRGEDAVLEWMRGTGLRPVLAALVPDEQAEFEAEYGARLRAAYPRQSFGTVLPYRRIFAVAQRIG
jgi:trans-aconitate 2-methyltransferase